MIFELLEECNDKDTVTVIIDNHTYNALLKVVLSISYNQGYNDGEEGNIKKRE